MATHAINPSVSRNPFAAFIGGFLNWMERYSETHARRSEITALEAKTDKELAKLGIRRDQIAYYVFRDLYYV